MQQAHLKSKWSKKIILVTRNIGRNANETIWYVNVDSMHHKHVVANLVYCIPFRVFFRQAVRRSRMKLKARTRKIENRVKWLRTNNKVLEGEIEKHQKDLKFLTDLYLAEAQTKMQTVNTEDLRKILQSDDSDDENDNLESNAKVR